jgi:hypothetical protein
MWDFESIILTIAVLIVYAVRLGGEVYGPVQCDYNLVAGLSLVPTALSLLISIDERQIQLGLFASTPVTLVFVLFWFLNHFIFSGVMQRSVSCEPPINSLW